MLYWLIVVHGLAVMAIILSPLALIFQLIFSLLMAVSLFFYLQFTPGVYTIRYSSFKGWEWRDLACEFSLLDVLSTTVMSPYFIVLQVQTDKRQNRTLFICKDAMLEDDYRRLLVTLKINGLKKNQT